MKSIIAETERNLPSRTPPKDGLSGVKWTPSTPPRPGQMPPSPGLPMLSSPSKKVDLRKAPALTPGSSTAMRPDTTSSGLSITRPQVISPVLVVAKQQVQSPQTVPMLKPSAYISPTLNRMQSTQISQPITPVKLGVNSPSIRRTSSVSSPDRPSLILISIVVGVAARHGRTCPTIPS